MNSNDIPKFAFIVHCRNTRELRLATARYRYALHRSLLPEKKLKQHCLESGYIEDIFTFRRVASDDGLECRGKAYCLLMTPDQMIENQTVTTERIITAGKMAEEWGARMLGLGAICAVVGARGVEVARGCSAAVTTGNSLTAYTSLKTYDMIMSRLDVDPAGHKVVLIGFPGSIILVIAKILNERGIDIILVSRRKTAFLKKFLGGFSSGTAASVEITQDIPSALRQGRIIFTATSAGQLISQDSLQPGSIVFDIAQPKDVIHRRPLRRDVLIVDTGLINLPRATAERYRYSGCRTNDIPSCLGETIALTFERRWENFSLGRELSLDKMYEIGGLAEQQGFVFNDFRTFQNPIPEAHFTETGRALRQA